jgi:hypothetical protein
MKLLRKPSAAIVCLALLSLAFVSKTVGLASDSVCKASSGSEVTGPGSCVGGDIFLKGRYVEVGIHPSASFGTSQSAPSTSAYGPQRLGKEVC